MHNVWYIASSKYDLYLSKVTNRSSQTTVNREVHIKWGNRKYKVLRERHKFLNIYNLIHFWSSRRPSFLTPSLPGQGEQYPSARDIKMWGLIWIYVCWIIGSELVKTLKCHRVQLFPHEKKSINHES